VAAIPESIQRKVIMALSQLQPFVIEGDRPAPAASGDMVKLPDGSLIMTGKAKPVEAKPGVLAGLRNFFASKLASAPAPQDQYWIPQPAAPVAPVAAPVVAGGPGTPLPAYNDPWGEIEQVANREKALADQLGTASKNILNNERLIQGKWFSNSAPKRVD
jgi:hypothetical protein